MSYKNHPLEQLNSPRTGQSSSKIQLEVTGRNGASVQQAPVLIHAASECDDCFEYALHIEATEEELSIRTATPNQHATHSSRHTSDHHATGQVVRPLGTDLGGTFHEGIELGRRLQREADDTSFAQYKARLERLERAEMERDELRRHRFRSEALEQELALVKDALVAAQMAYDDLAQELGKSPSHVFCQRCGTNNVGGEGTNGEDVDVGGAPANASAPISGSFTARQTSPERAPMPMPEPPGIAIRAPKEEAELWEDLNDFPHVEHEGHHLFGGNEALSLENADEDMFLLEQLQALDPRDLEEFWADYHFEHDSSARAYSPEYLVKGNDPERPSDALWLADSKSDSKAGPAILEDESALSIAQLSQLVEEARIEPDGDTAQIIQLLYEDAERTEGHHRTTAQAYLLLTWVTPAFVDTKGKGKATEYPQPLQPPRLLVPPTISRAHPSPLSPARENEIFVDACAYGIGFIYRDQWLAWTFTPKHPSIPATTPPHSRRAQINMSWAELVAAELGLRTLIACGLRDTTVVLRSDNGGVVNALRRGMQQGVWTWTSKWGLDSVLARVRGLCESAGLRVVPVWVWTKMNPADNPSRGVYGPKEMMVRTPPVIPPYLTGLVKLASPD